MMRFWSYSYTLQPKASLNAKTGATPREGALLKVQWPDSRIGYADLFPWPEFGDAPLVEQLKGLQSGSLFQLAEQAISLAKADAKLRSLGKNAFQNSLKIKNHFLIQDCLNLQDADFKKIKSGGFSTLKIKVGRSWRDEANWINKILFQNDFMIRLDFNSSMDLSSFQKMMMLLSPDLKKKIEFVEDPFPWNFEEWKLASHLVPLAIDQVYEQVPWKSYSESKEKTAMPFQVLVIKPSRSDFQLAVKRALEHKLKMVVTSSLDHAVGVAHAVRVAGELKEKYQGNILEAGCLSMGIYPADNFSKKMQVDGPYLNGIPGTGIGFDEELGAISWKPVNLQIL